MAEQTEKYMAARSGRVAEWQRLQTAYDRASGILESEWKKVKEGNKELQAKKDELAKQNGGAEVSDSDILDINAGGQIVSVCRDTLTQIKGSTLEAIFSGRWENVLQRDAKGRIFLDVNPKCFTCIVDYLNARLYAPPDNPPKLPRVEPEYQAVRDGLITAFGLGIIRPIDSKILTDASHVEALTGFLKDHGSGLELLYRGSEDGINNAPTFHQKCDNQGQTVTLVKSTGNYIFGGFSDQPWQSSGGHQRSNQSFLFGLHCHGGTAPAKMPLSGGNSQHAICNSESNGPLFGRGFDLALMGSAGVYSDLGKSYSIPSGSNSNYFTGSRKFNVAEIEVFKVSTPSSRAATPQKLGLDGFPEKIQKSLGAEEEALLEAQAHLLELEDSFAKEEAAVGFFCKGNDDKIVLLNVSGYHMAVGQSTLATYPNSVLYKDSADPNWKARHQGERKAVSPNEWDKKTVASWSKKIKGLSEDVSSHFTDVTGPELLVMGREDIKDLGIKRPGTVALVANAIQKLRAEEDANSVSLVRHSHYCIGKIIDHMRLKAMKDLGVPDPSPPIIREQDKETFQIVVGYCFPMENDASDLLS